jgi:Ca2+-binding RTX toxin-like protein
MRSALRFLIPGLFVFLIVATLTAVAATNTVPPTRIADHPNSFYINHLRPSACNGISVTNLVTGSGAILGTEGNDLILGSAGADTIDGLGGNDCILGGGGDDMLTGGDGSDVCIGGIGNATFDGCETEIQ